MSQFSDFDWSGGFGLTLTACSRSAKTRDPGEHERYVVGYLY